MKWDKEVGYDKMFRFCSCFFPTKRQMQNLYRKFQLHFPGNRKLAVKKSVQCALVIWGLETIVMSAVFATDPSIYGAACIILAIYVISEEVISRMESAAQIHLLEGIDSFLSDVRHYYYNYRMVEEAIYEAARSAGNAMRYQAERLMEVLEAEDVQEELAKYNDAVSNRFLRMFLALCVTVCEYGDKEVDGQYLFLLNIKYLKQEIAVEMQKRKEIKYRFSGLIWIAVIPVFTLPFIEKWAVGNLPELYGFYQGTGGIFLSVFIYLVTWITYCMLDQLKENKVSVRKEHKFLRLCLKSPAGSLIENYISRNYGRCKLVTELLRSVGDTRNLREYLLFRFLVAGTAGMVTVALFTGIHIQQRKQAFYVGKEITIGAGNVNRTQEEKMKAALPELVERYIGTGAEEEEIRTGVKEESIFHNRILEQEYAAEIYERVRAYDNAFLKWYEILAAFLAAVFTYAAVHVFLLYRKKLMQMEMEDEVVQYQSIILMMMHMDRMSILTILEMMENFAVVFRTAIQKCINDYNYGDLLALRKLREEAGFEPMRRLVDQFLLCDRIGIVNAFDEIAVERANFREKRKLDNEMNLTKKTVIGKVISYAPMVLTIGGYLIVPFVRESLLELLQYAAEMNAM